MNIYHSQEQVLCNSFLTNFNEINTLSFAPQFQTNIKPTILLAEDHSLIQKATYEALRCLNCYVDVLPDGRAALAHYQAHHHTYDLIILDINMPLMNGIEVCTYIRSVMQDQSIPIIAHSTFEQISQAQCYQVGFSFCINKPADMAQWKKLLEHLRKINP